jgi:hypothetical protein
MIVVTQLAWMAFQVGVFCAATFAAEEVIARLGYEASYTDRPQFLKWLGFFVGLPVLLWAMHGLAMFQLELDMAREERDRELEAGSVEPTLLEPTDDGFPPLGDDRSPRFIEHRSRDWLP